MPNETVQETVTNPSTQEETASTKTTLEGESLAKELEKTRKEAAKYRTQLRDYEEAQKMKELEEQKARGEYQNLYTQQVELNKTLQEELNTFKKSQEDEYGSLIKDWKEEDLALIPSSLPISEKLSLAKRLSSRLTPIPVPGTTSVVGNKHGKFGGFATKEEWAEKDPAGYIKQVETYGLNF